MRIVRFKTYLAGEHVVRPDARPSGILPGVSDARLGPHGWKSFKPSPAGIRSRKYEPRVNAPGKMPEGRGLGALQDGGFR